MNAISATTNIDVNPKAEKRRRTPWQRLWQDKMARAALIVLGLFYFSAIFADPLTPYSMNFSDSDVANCPPSLIHITDDNGNLCDPYVCATSRSFDHETFKQTFVEQPDKRSNIKMFCKGQPYRILGFIPGDIHLFGVDEPCRIFLLGADINGRDNFSRLFFGAQKSLTIGFLGLLITFPVGIIYGALAGFVGGKIDNVMMRFAEAIMSIPTFYLLIGLAAMLPAGMSSTERFALITVILSFVGWASLARVIRGMVLAIREEEFVYAAKAAGMSELGTVLRHVIPQTASFVIVSATLQVPYFILSESGLSFIGLGIQQPDASWGNMLEAARQNVNDLLNQPWLLAPGLAIFITILCFNTIGDVLRDVLDPKMYGSS